MDEAEIQNKTNEAQRRIDSIIEMAHYDGSGAAFGDLQVYELHKSRIAQVCVSAEMYEDAIKRLCVELHV